MPLNEHVAEPFRRILNDWYSQYLQQSAVHPCQHTGCTNPADLKCAAPGCTTEICVRHAHLCQRCVLPFCDAHTTKHASASHCQPCREASEAEMERFYRQMGAAL